MKVKCSLAFFFILINLLSCNEDLKLAEKDIRKYDYLNPFLVSNAIKFEGIHNIDTEDFEFSYLVSNVRTTCSLIRENASKSSWHTNSVDEMTTSYSKKVRLFEGETTLVVVRVMIKNKSNRIYFSVN